MPLQPIEPFEPIRVEEPPEGDAWTAQIKWDGVRVLAYRSGGETRLFNRRRNERTLQYPELADAARYCSAESVVLDGEVIALDEKGLPSFSRVMQRDSLRKAASVAANRDRVPIVYMVFDLLHLDGEWVNGRPLRERRRLLESVLRPGESVQLAEDFPRGADLLAVMRRHGMEGIVCKELDSGYAPGGKDKRWRKVKIYRDLHAVIGGVTYRGKTVNALALGLYLPDGRLQAIGYAGTGKLSARDWADLTEAVRPLATDRCPFDVPNGLVRGTTWLAPALTAKVQYQEWTPHRTLRQPSIQALQAAEPSACTFEQA